MKKGILKIVIVLLIIGIGYFGIQMLEFAQVVNTDTKKNNGIQKDPLSDYQNAELQSFYQDFKTEIIETNWLDEPIGRLYGVIFRINENKYYEIELDSIPRMHKENLKFNWRLNEVGKSKIRNIKLVEKN